MTELPPYLPRGRITLWDFMKNYFNEFLGDIISRTNIIYDLTGNGYNNITSIDTYRNYLTKAGYLSIVRRGVYRVEKEIPIDLSVSDCQEIAYHGNKYGYIVNLQQKKQQKDFIKQEEMEIV